MKTTCRSLPPWVISRADYKELWENSYWLPDISTIQHNVIILDDGITGFGARYPSFTITNNDIKVIKDVMLHYSLIPSPGSTNISIHRCAHNIVRYIQKCLMTNTFNNRCDNNISWNNFDSYSDIFRNSCLKQQSFNKIKEVSRSYVPLNICLLFILFGDCREHNILLHVMMKILINSHNEFKDNYDVSSIYTTGGKDRKIPHNFHIL